MTKRLTADAVVIGAGIIGTAIAYELAKTGRKTWCLDRLPAAGYGSTSSSCAIIRVHYSTVPGTAFAYDGYFDWLNWREYLDLESAEPLARFIKTGCLVMKTHSNGYLQKIVENVATLQIPFEEWDRARILERLPNYDLNCFAPAKRVEDPMFGQATGGEIGGAVFFPTAGFVNDPQLATQNIARAAERICCRMEYIGEVVSIDRDGNRVAGVTLADGRVIAAPIVVNVGGPHSSILNALAGVTDDMNISTRALRQEVAHVPAPAGIDFESTGLVVSDSDIGVYCRPEQGNFVLAGSEDPPCDVHQWVDDPDNFSRDFSEQATTQALRLAQRMTGLTIPSRIGGVVDLYDVSDDWLPIYDRSALAGFYMACGSSGNQFKNAPAAGRLMAGLIDYCESGADHDSEPFQFSLKHTNYVLDTAEMSRRRTVNANSSFSVLG
ncbi:MAG: NAD(P)/FAD-dependent oxidoreductase [Arenicellales bacterium]